MPTENVIETDVLVIGGGLAGIFAAMKAREKGVDVTLVDKNYVSRSGATAFADGCFSIFNPEWGHDLDFWMDHIRTSGEYMNNPEWTKISLKDSYDRYQDLVSWGIEFLKRENGELIRYRKADIGIGCLDWCLMGRGWKYLPIMRQQLLNSGVKILDRIMIIDLLKQDGQVVGAVGFHTMSGDFYTFKAKATVMSTGNGTTNKDVAGIIVRFLSYDGEAMAYRAGADIRSKEFCNTGSMGFIEEKDEAKRVSLEGKSVDDIPGKYPTWVSYGPHLSFINDYVDAEGYAVYRHTAANAIHEGRGPLLWNLDVASPVELEHTLLDIKASDTAFRLDRVGMDLSKGGLWSGVLRVESGVGHNIFGGGAGISSIDTECASSLPGLYAAGDVCHTGSLGASYPSFGFGLRNAAVTGARAGWSAAQYTSGAEKIVLDKEKIADLKRKINAPLDRAGGFSPDWVFQQMQSLVVPYYIWFFRHGERLKAALTLIEFLRNHIGPKLYAKDAHGLRLVHETRNRVLSVEMMLKSALFRTESRACHFREDFPRREDPAWLAWVKLKEQDGGMALMKEPLPESWWPDLSKPYRERYLRKFRGEK